MDCSLRSWRKSKAPPAGRSEASREMATRILSRPALNQSLFTHSKEKGKKGKSKSMEELLKHDLSVRAGDFTIN
jgi:hypothetical protein